MQEMSVDYKIRIPQIDKLLTEHNNNYVSLVSVDNTKEEKNKLRELDNSLVKEIDYVNNIVCEVLEYLEARGCETSEYI